MAIYKEYSSYPLYILQNKRKEYRKENKEKFVFKKCDHLYVYPIDCEFKPFKER